MKRRMADALRTADSAPEVPDYPELVDAVLAEMTEPTDHMIAVATDLGPNATLRDLWRAMIGAVQ